MSIVNPHYAKSMLYSLTSPQQDIDQLSLYGDILITDFNSHYHSRDKANKLKDCFEQTINNLITDLEKKKSTNDFKIELHLENLRNMLRLGPHPLYSKQPSLGFDPFRRSTTANFGSSTPAPLPRRLSLLSLADANKPTLPSRASQDSSPLPTFSERPSSVLQSMEVKKPTAVRTIPASISDSSGIQAPTAPFQPLLVARPIAVKRPVSDRLPAPGSFNISSSSSIQAPKASFQALSIARPVAARPVPDRSSAPALNLSGPVLLGPSPINFSSRIFKPKPQEGNLLNVPSPRTVPMSSTPSPRSNVGTPESVTSEMELTSDNDDEIGLDFSSLRIRNPL